MKALETTARADGRPSETSPARKRPGRLAGSGPITRSTRSRWRACIRSRCAAPAGRPDLAERVWAAATGRTRDEMEKSKIDVTGYGVNYVTMANDLAWYHFDRAVCAGCAATMRSPWPTHGP